MTTRRNFIQQSGLLAAGLVLASACTSGETNNENKTADTTGTGTGDDAGKIVGLQLYSLRNEIVKDVNGVIAKVATAGYKNVETYGYDIKNLFWGQDPKTFKKLLDDNQLVSSSGHYNPDNFLSGKGNDDEIKQFIDAAKILNQEYVIIPYLPEELRKNADDYKVIADKMNKAAELCKEAGIELAYHNHDFEFQPQGAQTGYDILLKETDPSIVKMELDLYWVVRAGKDPTAIFNQSPGRFVAWHVKDMDKKDPKLNTEIGNGSIDYKKIFAESELSGVKHYIVEQENYKIDPFESIQKSCAYVKDELMKG